MSPEPVDGVPDYLQRLIDAADDLPLRHRMPRADGDRPPLGRADPLRRGAARARRPADREVRAPAQPRRAAGVPRRRRRPGRRLPGRDGAARGRGGGRRSTRPASGCSPRCRSCSCRRRTTSSSRWSRWWDDPRDVTRRRSARGGAGRAGAAGRPGRPGEPVPAAAPRRASSGRRSASPTWWSGASPPACSTRSSRPPGWPGRGTPPTCGRCPSRRPRRAAAGLGGRRRRRGRRRADGRRPCARRPSDAYGSPAMTGDGPPAPHGCAGSGGPRAVAGGAVLLGRLRRRRAGRARRVHDRGGGGHGDDRAGRRPGGHPADAGRLRVHARPLHRRPGKVRLTVVNVAKQATHNFHFTPDKGPARIDAASRCWRPGRRRRSSSTCSPATTLPVRLPRPVGAGRHDDGRG